MARDLIVDEVRAIREGIAKEHGYNLRKIVQTLQREQKECGKRLVSLAPKRLTEASQHRRAS
jgi:hypothetical protein